MLSKSELETRTVAQLVDIQKCLRGQGTEKAKGQFDLAATILEGKGGHSICWTKLSEEAPKKKPEEKPAKRTISGLAASMTQKELRAFNTAAFADIRDNEDIDEATRRELQVGSKHQQLYYSAMSRGKDFDLRLSDVRKLLASKKCAYTGIKFDTSNPRAFPTVDRIDETKGYVRGNVVMVACVANNVKNHVLELMDSSCLMNEDELMAFATNMLKLRGAK